MAQPVTFTKRYRNDKMEMRTSFGRNMALTMTKTNGYFYINLYNNNPRCKGNCPMGLDEMEELCSLMSILTQVKEEFKEEDQQHSDKWETAPPHPPPQPPTQPPTQPTQQQHHRTGAPPAKRYRTEDYDPMDYFSELQ
ncbi:Hypothetical predicted protein [Mytilus galloprovincialis]|uniref:Uncharacterized protein n=1 Tax=Mytilus galloprovincialis TaxID=29158 RepID=A0A8B6GXV5_MYTGA|nr:Hypothetical predicted protein [Mytilus galloprovincialis]